MRTGWWTCLLVVLGALVIASRATAGDIPCNPTGVEVPAASPSAAATPGTLPVAPWLGVTGRKYWAPEAQRAEAGVSLNVSENVSILLNYERTAYGDTSMPRDEDNGVLTRLKLGF